jgi:hypothetical protein
LDPIQTKRKKKQKKKVRDQAHSRKKPGWTQKARLEPIQTRNTKKKHIPQDW